MGRKRAKHRERVSSQANKRLESKALSRSTAKSSYEFKTLAWFGDFFREIHGEGILVYVKNLPLIYIKKGSSLLNLSDKLLFSTYDKQKQILVSYPMADDLPNISTNKDVSRFFLNTPFLLEAINKESARAQVRVAVSSELSQEELKQSFMDYEFIF